MSVLCVQSCHLYSTEMLVVSLQENCVQALNLTWLCTECVNCSRLRDKITKRAWFVSVLCVQSCRLYSTKMLRVLLRASTPGFSSWGVELLVTQLYDQSSAVASAALTILDEACDIEVCT